MPAVCDLVQADRSGKVIAPHPSRSVIEEAGDANQA